MPVYKSTVGTQTSEVIVSVLLVQNRVTGRRWKAWVLFFAPNLATEPGYQDTTVVKLNSFPQNHLSLLFLLSKLSSMNSNTMTLKHPSEKNPKCALFCVDKTHSYSIVIMLLHGVPFDKPQTVLYKPFALAKLKFPQQSTSCLHLQTSSCADWTDSGLRADNGGLSFFFLLTIFTSWLLSSGSLLSSTSAAANS